MRGTAIPYEGLQRFEAAASDEALRGRPWSVWATFAWTCAGILFVSLPEIANRGWSLNLSLGTIILWALMAYSAVVVMVLLATRPTLVPIRDYLGLARPRVRDILLGVGCAILSHFIMPFIMSIVAPLIQQAVGSSPKVLDVQSLSVHMFVLGLIVTIIVAPIAEELLFRGFMYRGLESRLGAFGVLLMTSVIFGVTHRVYGYGWDHVVQSFFFGLLLGSLRWRTGGITASIVTHAIINSPIVPIFLHLLGG